MPRCKHLKFQPHVKMEYFRVNPLDLTQTVLVVRIACSECGDPFRFKAPEAYSTHGPTASLDRVTLYAPILFPFDDEREKKNEAKVVN